MITMPTTDSYLIVFMGILVSDILYQTGLDIFVKVVGMVDSVCTVFVIGYWLFDVGIVDEVVFTELVVVDEVVIIGIVDVLSGVTLALGSDNLVDGHGLFDL